jgi:hypothetical protein
MSVVRRPKNPTDYKEGEYSTFCSGCDCELAVTPPDKLRGDDDRVFDWLGSHYFYCKSCQKSEDRPEVEEG